MGNLKRLLALFMLIGLCPSLNLIAAYLKKNPTQANTPPPARPLPPTPKATVSKPEAEKKAAENIEALRKAGYSENEIKLIGSGQAGSLTGDKSKPFGVKEALDLAEKNKQKLITAGYSPTEAAKIVEGKEIKMTVEQAITAAQKPDFKKFGTETQQTPPKTGIVQKIQDVFASFKAGITGKPLDKKPLDGKPLASKPLDEPANTKIKIETEAVKKQKQPEITRIEQTAKNAPAAQNKKELNLLKKQLSNIKKILKNPIAVKNKTEQYRKYEQKLIGNIKIFEKELKTKNNRLKILKKIKEEQLNADKLKYIQLSNKIKEHEDITKEGTNKKLNELISEKIKEIKKEQTVLEDKYGATPSKFLTIKDAIKFNQ